MWMGWSIHYTVCCSLFLPLLFLMRLRNLDVHSGDHRRGFEFSVLGNHRIIWVWTFGAQVLSSAIGYRLGLKLSRAPYLEVVMRKLNPYLRRLFNWCTRV